MKHILFILLLTLHFCLDAQSADDDFELIQTEIQTNQGLKKVYQLRFISSESWKFTEYMYYRGKRKCTAVINDNYDFNFSFIWNKVKIKKLKNGPYTVITGGRRFCESTIIIIDKYGRDILHPNASDHDDVINVIQNIYRKQKDIGSSNYSFYSYMRKKYESHPDFQSLYQLKEESDPEYIDTHINLRDTTLKVRKLTMYGLHSQVWSSRWFSIYYGASDYTVSVNPCIMEEYDVWTNIKLPSFSQDSFTIMAGGERDGWTSIAIVDSKYRDVFGPDHPLKDKLTSYFIRECRKIEAESNPEYDLFDSLENEIAPTNNITVSTAIEPHTFSIEGKSIELHRFQIITDAYEMARFFSRYFYKYERKWQDYTYISNQEEGFYTWRDVHLPGFEEKFTIITGGKLFCEASITILDFNGRDVLNESHPFFLKVVSLIKDVILQDILKASYSFHANEGEMLRKFVEEAPLELEKSEHAFIKTIFPANESGIPNTPIHNLTFFEMGGQVFADFFMILHAGKWDGYYTGQTCMFQEFAIWKDVQFPDVSQEKYTVITSGALDSWPSIMLLDEDNNDVFAEDAPDREKWATYFYNQYLNVNTRKASHIWAKYDR